MISTVVCWLVVCLFLGWAVGLGWYAREMLSIAFAIDPVRFWRNPWYWLFFRRNARYERLAAEVRARATECGLPPVPCSVWTIRRWVRPRTWRAQAWIPSGLVVIHTARGPYTDMAIKVILAHEYGHLVDFFWGRTVHPLLVRFGSSDREALANVIAAYLWGSDAVIDIFNHHHLSCQAEQLRKLEFTRPWQFKQ